MKKEQIVFAFKILLLVFIIALIISYRREKETIEQGTQDYEQSVAQDSIAEEEAFYAKMEAISESGDSAFVENILSNMYNPELVYKMKANYDKAKRQNNPDAETYARIISFLYRKQGNKEMHNKWALIWVEEYKKTSITK